jgi:hypothetical protein
MFETIVADKGDPSMRRIRLLAAVAVLGVVMPTRLY